MSLLPVSAAQSGQDFPRPHIRKGLIPEEVELSRRIQAGDADALAELVERNEALARKISRKFFRKSGCLKWQDILQEARIGLITAARKYDPAVGCRFSTYATYWVNQHIIRAIRTTGRFIRLPSHIYDRRQVDSHARTRLLNGWANSLPDRESRSVEVAEIEALRAALESLPEDQRRAIEVHFGIVDQYRRFIDSEAPMTKTAQRAIRNLRKALKSNGVQHDGA